MRLRRRNGLKRMSCPHSLQESRKLGGAAICGYTVMPTWSFVCGRMLHAVTCTVVTAVPAAVSDPNVKSDAAPVLAWDSVSAAGPVIAEIVVPALMFVPTTVI